MHRGGADMLHLSCGRLTYEQLAGGCCSAWFEPAAWLGMRTGLDAGAGLDAVQHRVPVQLGCRRMLLAFFIRTICLGSENHHDTNYK